MTTQTERPTRYAGSMPRSTQQLAAWHAVAPVAEPLEPALPIVDPHHHLFGALPDSHHYRLEDLQQDLAGGHRIIGTVYIEAYQSGWRTTGPEALRPVGEVEHIAALTVSSVRTTHGPCQVAAGIVSHVDLTLGDGAAEPLEQQLAAGAGRLRGVRHCTATDAGAVGSFIKHLPRPELLREPSFRRGVAQLGRLGLRFDAWIYHTQIEELIELADIFPDTTIVLDHVGGVIGVAEYRPRHAEVLGLWEQRLRKLAQRPNVRLKIGGMGMPVFGFEFDCGERPATSKELARAWQPTIEVAIDAFGTARCMFESNFPVDKQSCSYTELWNAFKLATASLTSDERSDLFYRTACRTYRLTELEALADQR